MFGFFERKQKTEKAPVEASEQNVDGPEGETVVQGDFGSTESATTPEEGNNESARMLWAAKLPVPQAALPKEFTDFAYLPEEGKVTCKDENGEVQEVYVHEVEVQYVDESDRPATFVGFAVEHGADGVTMVETCNDLAPVQETVPWNKILDIHAPSETQQKVA